jgi:hypothetical protein
VDSGVVESRQEGKWTHYSNQRKSKRLRRRVAQGTDETEHGDREKYLLQRVKTIETMAFTGE